MVAFGFWYWKNNQSHVRFFLSNTVLKVSIILIIIFSIVGLGLIYGIIMAEYVYPQIVEYGVKNKQNNPLLALSHSIDTSNTDFLIDSLYLIQKNEKELIFYDKPHYQVIYVSSDVIKGRQPENY